MDYQLSLRQYHYFKVLAEELHFRRAAEKLFISQPGLSRQIKQMEDLYATPLLLRNKRNIELTYAGRYLLQEADYILNYIQSMETRIRKIGTGNKIELSIGFIGSASQLVLPELIKGLSDSGLEVETVMEELSNTVQVQEIQQGKLDLGFVRMSRAPRGLSLQTIYEESFSLVVPQDFDSQQDDPVLHAKDNNFILFSSTYSTEYYELIMSIFNDYQFSPKVSHKSVNALTIFKLVEEGLGVAIVPTSLQTGYQPAVRFIELLGIRQRTKLSVIWNPENRNPGLSPALDLLLGKK